MRKRARRLCFALFASQMVAGILPAFGVARAETPPVINLPAKPAADGPVSTGPAIPAVATNMSKESLARHDDCIAKTEKAPQEAYEDGLAWRLEGGGALALHCVARAQLALGFNDEAAERLELVASMREVNDPNMRAVFLIEAGHAFLLAHRNADARRNFDAAVLLLPNDPDLRLDRAETALLASDWKGAAADAEEALKLRPNDPQALRMRGEAKLALQDFAGAAADAEAALKADSSYVPALVLRGKAREAKAGRPYQ